MSQYHAEEPGTWSSQMSEGRREGIWGWWEENKWEPVINNAKTLPLQ